MDQAIHEIRLKKWLGIMQEYASSGKTKAEWCREQGIKRRSFFYWQKRLQEYALERMPEEKEQKAGTGLSLISERKPVVFCEINRFETSNPGETEVERTGLGFHAEMAIQRGNYNILIGSNVTEKALSTVLAVISHA